MSQRARRVSEAVKEVLAERLGDLKDPRIGFVTLTDVRTTPDLRQSEVFYTVLPDDEETRSATREGLMSARPLLRREVGEALRLRHVPELGFTEDPVPAQARRIDSLLRDDRPSEGEEARGVGERRRLDDPGTQRRPSEGEEARGVWERRRLDDPGAQSRPSEGEEGRDEAGDR